MNKNCKEKHRTAEEVYCCLTCTPHKEDKLTQLTDLLADKTLSFGCRLKHPTHKGRWIITEIEEGKYVYTRNVETNKGVMFTNEMIEYDKGVKIIGHPVTLARVLSQLDFIRAGREFEGEVLKIFYRWDLTKDTLDQQSPETINYLAELLI